MSPDESSRLASVIRALSDIVLPAVREDEPLAQEQLQLAIGHLAIIQAQIEGGHDFKATELADRQSLAQALLEITKTEDAIKPQVEHLSGLADSGGLVPISQAIQELIFAVSTISDEEIRLSVFETVLQHESARAVKDRRWFEPMGFDAEMSAS